jgi:hypothetical protein
MRIINSTYMCCEIRFTAMRIRVQLNEAWKNGPALTATYAWEKLHKIIPPCKIFLMQFPDLTVGLVIFPISVVPDEQAGQRRSLWESGPMG